MEHTRALAFASRYFLYTTVIGIFGLVVTAVGGYVVITGITFGEAWIFGIPYPHGSTRAYLGVIPVVLGVALWRLGKAWALYATMTAAMSHELADTYDTEHVKSDIVAVLDNRLSDMQQDLQSVNRELRSVKTDDGFEFGTEE